MNLVVCSDPCQEQCQNRNISPSLILLFLFPFSFPLVQHFAVSPISISGSSIDSIDRYSLISISRLRLGLIHYLDSRSDCSQVE